MLTINSASICFFSRNTWKESKFKWLVMLWQLSLCVSPVFVPGRDGYWKELPVIGVGLRQWWRRWVKTFSRVHGQFGHNSFLVEGIWTVQNSTQRQTSIQCMSFSFAWVISHALADTSHQTRFSSHFISFQQFELLLYVHIPMYKIAYTQYNTYTHAYPPHISGRLTFREVCIIFYGISGHVTPTAHQKRGWTLGRGVLRKVNDEPNKRLHHLNWKYFVISCFKTKIISFLYAILESDTDTEWGNRWSDRGDISFQGWCRIHFRHEFWFLHMDMFVILQNWTWK